MGCCCSQPGDELPAASDEEIQALREKGYLPCVAIPSVDFQGDNQLQTLYVALYENGVELTLLFMDEDRPNACEDCLYDTLRRPLFGRFSDIESVLIIGDKMEFPGTYSADQVWKSKIPQHKECCVDLSSFQKRDEGEEPLLWVNTWNHLLGEKNNNTDLDITYMQALPAGSTEASQNKNYVVRKGSRSEVDQRFKGLMTTVSTVMTEEREKKLGKRLY